VCESVGYCSFPDSTCAGGRRYGDYSGKLAGQCIGGDAKKDAAPDTPPGYYRIGGSVSGLTGTGMTLQNNGGDDLPITMDGPFAFATPLMTGAVYSVNVTLPPTNQTVSITNASGMVGTGDVTNIALTCHDITGGDPGILCGTGINCQPVTQHCCRGGGNPSQCLPTATACSVGQSLACDDTADCSNQPGTVCCAGLSGGGMSAMNAQCMTLASCPASHIVLCDPNVASECTNNGAGGTCQSATQSNMAGYFECR
jgi:hypothetical protein